MIKSKINRKYFLQNFFIIIILGIIFLMVAFPQVAISSFLEGILIWAKSVMPALLPFFILSKLLSFTPFLTTLGNKLSPITKKLYGVGGVSGYVYIMSIISGYPVGAKITADLYSGGTINSGQAQVISSFTSTSGPLFIIGTVAIGFYNSAKLGFIILISHFVSAIINGLIYRKTSANDSSYIQSVSKPSNIIGDTMKSSIESILLVGGFIALFYMLLSILTYIKAFSFITYPLSILGIDSSITLGIISGILEVTSGAKMLSLCVISFELQAIILSFLVSFGGFSIHAQAYAFLKSFNMPYYNFFLQKFTHATISMLITLIIVLII